MNILKPCSEFSFSLKGSSRNVCLGQIVPHGGQHQWRWPIMLLELCCLVGHRRRFREVKTQNPQAFNKYMLWKKQHCWWFLLFGCRQCLVGCVRLGLVGGSSLAEFTGKVKVWASCSLATVYCFFNCLPFFFWSTPFLFGLPLLFFVYLFFFGLPFFVFVYNNFCLSTITVLFVYRFLFCLPFFVFCLPPFLHLSTIFKFCLPLFGFVYQICIICIL